MVGIDSPCRAADPGKKSRLCERDLRGAVCGIRYTPDADTITSGGTYYEWIRNGFALYEALAAVALAPGWQVIEVFPTASWTRLYKRRESARRASWSRAALASLSLNGPPARRLNQDEVGCVRGAREGAEHRHRVDRQEVGDPLRARGLVHALPTREQRPRVSQPRSLPNCSVSAGRSPGEEGRIKATQPKSAHPPMGCLSRAEGLGGAVMRLGNGRSGETGHGRYDDRACVRAHALGAVTYRYLRLWS